MSFSQFIFLLFFILNLIFPLLLCFLFLIMQFLKISLCLPFLLFLKKIWHKSSARTVSNCGRFPCKQRIPWHKIIRAQQVFLELRNVISHIQSCLSVLGFSFHFGATFLLISIAHIHLHFINRQLSSPFQTRRLHLEKRVKTGACTVFSLVSH